MATTPIQPDPIELTFEDFQNAIQPLTGLYNAYGHRMIRVACSVLQQQSVYLHYENKAVYPPKKMITLDFELISTPSGFTWKLLTPVLIKN